MSDWANEKEEMEHAEYIHLQDTEELEAEISRLKGELLASNKGAKTNAEVNKLAVKEIDRLKGELDKIRNQYEKDYQAMRNVGDLWKQKAEALAAALKESIGIGEDAVNQQRYPDGSPSYFDGKWGWTEGLNKAKEALKHYESK